LGVDKMLAYILMSFRPGTERESLDTISAMEEVKDCHMLFGEWDIIAKVDFSDAQTLERFIVDKIRTLPGAKLTSTMIVAK